LLLATVCWSSALHFGPHITAHIRNELSPDKVLYVHCHCTDGGQDAKYLNVGSEYSWTFYKHLLRKTLWQCYLAPDNNNHVYFHVYDKKTPSFDFDLIFAAKEDGVYYRNQDSHSDELFSSWKLGLWK
ncbi:S-protein homolog 1, partial [Linum grandiflorum]